MEIGSSVKQPNGTSIEQWLTQVATGAKADKLNAYANAFGIDVGTKKQTLMAIHQAMVAGRVAAAP